MNRDTQTGKDLLSRKNVDLPLKRWEKKAGQFAVTLKEIIQRFLRSKGFEIRRNPAYEIERYLRIADIDLPGEIDCETGYWERWLSHDPHRFAEVYARNRAFQQTVDQWISQETYDQSVWRYGIPGGPQALDSIERGITYTDLLAFLGTLLPEIRYLELGVSAGKNFIQLVHQFEDALLVGFEIEDINPVIASYLAGPRTVWQSERSHPFNDRRGQVREKRFALHEYDFAGRNNTVRYLCGDKFKQEAWSALDGTTFNLVFSDACHVPESLDTELEFMIRHDLIDRGGFIMLWDDLDPNLIPAFVRCVSRLGTMFDGASPFAAIYELHGTYSGRHRIGAFFSEHF